MKYFWLTVMLLLSNHLLFAQQDFPTPVYPELNSDTLYQRALNHYAMKLDSNGIQGTKKDTIYLQERDFVDSFPNQVSNKTLKVLTKENWKRVFRQQGNELMLVKLFPMQVDQQKLRISMNRYQSKLEKDGGLLHEIVLWINVYFKYNCRAERWEHWKTMVEGI